MTETIEQLTRWLDHGGTCRLEQRRADCADVVLCRCDGGEEVERFRTADPALMAWVRANAE